jgi:hypothetical protein
MLSLVMLERASRIEIADEIRGTEQCDWPSM